MNEKRLAEILARKKEIATEIETLTDVAVLEQRSKELDDLNGEYETIIKRAEILGKAAPKDGENLANNGEAERRATDLLNLRTITVGSSNIVVPKHVSSDIKPSFNQISSIVDLVDIRNFPNGDTYTQSFMKYVTSAGNTLEGQAYHEVNPVWDNIDIVKTVITAYAEDTKQVLKLPLADYDREVMDAVRKSIRIYLSREIISGNGSANHLTGIFNAPAKVIPTDTDLSITAINENTLDEIIFKYGGDEDVEGMAVLILNKIDLKAFAMVKGTQDKRRVYDIELMGNTGYINKIPFILNSACGVLSAADTVADTYCMAYGNLSNYQLAVFSDIEVARSMDYKFKEGILAHRGDMYAGGNVTKWKGFVRVKKGGA